jgi:hypothetical protein
MITAELPLRPCEEPGKSLENVACLGSMSCEPIRNRVRALIPDYEPLALQDVEPHGFVNVWEGSHAFLQSLQAERRPEPCPMQPRVVIFAMAVAGLEALQSEHELLQQTLVIPVRGNTFKLGILPENRQFTEFGNSEHVALAVLYARRLRAMPSLWDPQEKRLFVPEFIRTTELPLTYFKERHPNLALV